MFRGERCIYLTNHLSLADDEAGNDSQLDVGFKVQFSK